MDCYSSHAYAVCLALPPHSLTEAEQMDLRPLLDHKVFYLVVVTFLIFIDFSVQL